MTQPLHDLEKFRGIGDEEAAGDLARILARLTPEERGQLPKTLGKWDPSQCLSKLPEPVREYVSTPFEMPEWAEPGRIRKAQEAYESRHGLYARIVLAAYSLPILYLHPETSLTLSFTGELLLHVRRRLEDTLAFVDGVMAPCSLESGSKGQQWIRKVRLTHAMVREKIRNGDPRARAAAQQGAAATFGARLEDVPAHVFDAVKDRMPLDQVEQAFVLQTFAWVIVEGLDEMGWKMPANEAADHIHVWSVIGDMLGIHIELLPRGISALNVAQALFEQIRDEQLKRGDPLAKDPQDGKDTWLAGRLLAAAWVTMLIQIQRERVPGGLKPWLEQMPWLDEALQQMPRVLIRRLCGVRAARYLRIGRAPFLHWLVCRLALMYDMRRVAKDDKAPPSDVQRSGARA